MKCPSLQFQNAYHHQFSFWYGDTCFFQPLLNSKWPASLCIEARMILNSFPELFFFPRPPFIWLQHDFKWTFFAWLQKFQKYFSLKSSLSFKIFHTTQQYFITYWLKLKPHLPWFRTWSNYRHLTAHEFDTQYFLLLVSTSLLIGCCSHILSIL